MEEAENKEANPQAGMASSNKSGYRKGEVHHTA